MAKKSRKKINFFQTNPFLIILLIVFVLIIVFLSKNMYKDYRVNKDIEQLVAQIEELEQQNLELAEVSRYFSSEIFLEEQARTTLGLKKAGEKNIVIEDLDGLSEGESATQEVQTQGSEKNVRTEKESNYKKWYQYFFSNKE